jgi:acetyltransferase-like isoleucine patch superfamily enzyme
MRRLMALARSFRTVWDWVWSYLARTLLHMKGVRLGTGVRFVGIPVVSVAEGSLLSLGNRALLCSRDRCNSLGVNHPVVLRTIGPEARLVIGDDVGISGASICASVGVEIGDGCLIGANALIVDTDFHPSQGQARRYAPNPKPRPEDRVVIGANVFVGAGAMILKGSTIGPDVTVGAGAVVSGDVPAGAVALGNPARVLRHDS